VDGHIPYERIVEIADFNNTGKRALAMPATYLGVPPSCVGCAPGACSVVLLSHDEGHQWHTLGEEKGADGANQPGFMSGISQFVVLANGSWLALGRGGSNSPCGWPSTFLYLRAFFHLRGSQSSNVVSGIGAPNRRLLCLVFELPMKSPAGGEG
jgi:hypothetical protein